MSVQDDNTIVSKGDLKNLYQNKILPYIGHNVVMSTNNSTYYSTDEKIVGVWTDGKPLYQKTVDCGALPNATNKTVEHGISDIEKAVSISGYSCRTTDTNCIPIPYAPYEDVTGGISVTCGETYIKLLTGMDRTAFTETCITVLYTKTTDEASSATTTAGAYDINFPNTWAENTQIYFGNGLYGYRATGNFEATSAGSGGTINLISALSSYVTIASFGGSCNIYNTNGEATTRTLGGTPFFDATMGANATLFFITQGSSKRINFGYYFNTDYTTTDSTYDIWFTYYTT